MAYNLAVVEIRTYFVLAGRVAVLVHNTGCFPDLSGLRGANPEDILDRIPDNWIVTSPKGKTPGIKFTNPNNKNHVIIYEPGSPNNSLLDHQGPYLRVTDGVNPVYRIPLAGNPALGVQ